MPIRPENRHRYPTDWPTISWAIRDGRAGWRCECTGLCGRPAGHLAGDGRCRNRQGQRTAETGARVVLTVAHLDHTPENCDPANLAAMCQGCHLHYDRDHHAETRAAARAAAISALYRELAAQMDPLFPLPLASTVEASP
jgi:hypothetical protein